MKYFFTWSSVSMERVVLSKNIENVINVNDTACTGVTFLY